MPEPLFWRSDSRESQKWFFLFYFCVFLKLVKYNLQRKTFLFVSILLCPIATLQCKGMARGAVVLVGGSDFSLWDNGQNLWVQNWHYNVASTLT